MLNIPGRQFVPSNEFEEVLLVLLVGEAMAVRDAVLSQAPEFGAARDHALHNAVALVDLLALAATRWGQLCLVLEVGAGRGKGGAGDAGYNALTCGCCSRWSAP